VLVNMDEGRKRLEHMRHEPRVALDLLDESDWYTHVSMTGHVKELREDTDLADIDRLARQYTGRLYPRRDRRWISAWIAVDGCHPLACAEGQQPAGLSECLPLLNSRNRVFCARRKGLSRAIADRTVSLDLKLVATANGHVGWWPADRLDGHGLLPGRSGSR
jgi:hypothetical protein